MAERKRRRGPEKTRRKGVRGSTANIMWPRHELVAALERSLAAYAAAKRNGQSGREHAHRARRLARALEALPKHG